MKICWANSEIEIGHGKTGVPADIRIRYGWNQQILQGVMNKFLGH